jgi:hypothetical protein
MLVQAGVQAAVELEAILRARAQRVKETAEEILTKTVLAEAEAGALALWVVLTALLLFLI